MATSYGAICTDFFINLKVGFKMPLPRDRDSVLHFFDQARKFEPTLQRFRRYDDEFVLESPRRESEYRWLSIRGSALRSGHVNPDSMDLAHAFHREVARIAPYHLTVSPIDIDHIELLYGFELECEEDQDTVVVEALFENTPLASLMDVPDAKTLSVRPAISLLLNQSGDLQAFFEIKTRRKSRRGSARGSRGEPIGLYLTVRRYGPIGSMDELPQILGTLRSRCDWLAEERFLPHVVLPISQRITTSGR